MQATERHSETTTAPPRILLREKYKITINFLSVAQAKTNYWISDGVCSQREMLLNQQNGYVVPELFDLRSQGGHYWNFILPARRILGLRLSEVRNTEFSLYSENRPLLCVVLVSQSIID